MTADADGHAPFEEFAVRHVMGGLEDPQAQVFRAHLLDCGECRARVGELRALASQLADIERDERRERAFKAIETKRREEAEQDERARVAPAVPGLRAMRIALVVGLALITVLAVWNMTLRNHQTGLIEAVEAERRISAIVNFGEPWDRVDEGQVDGTARSADGEVAVMLDGISDDEAEYGVYQLDANDRVLSFNPAVSRDGRVRLRMNLVPGTAQVEVWRSRDGVSRQVPQGELLFAAEPASEPSPEAREAES